MHTIDLIIFLAFTGGIVLMGASFFRKKTSADEFTAASRSLPAWVVGMSIFSTYVSSISYLGYPGRAYTSDWNAFVFSLSIPIASYIAARWFVPFYRKQNSVSAYAFLEERFGRWARWYASACYLLTQIARIGSIMFLLALPMNVLLGWDIHWIIVLTSIAIIFYSMLGGVRGVIWADAIQGFIMIGGALACLAVLLFSMPEGPSQAFTMAWEDGKFSLGSLDITSLGESTFWVCLIYGIFINLQNYGIDQNYVQRYHAAKTDRAARNSALFGGWLSIPVSAVFFLIGTALYTYYKAYPGLLPEDMTKGDYVFPYFIVHQLPVGITGLLIASIFAAGMSTVSTSITSAATVILTDYWKPLAKHSSEDGHIIVLRLSSIIVGLLGIVISLALVSVDGVLDAWWKLSSIFSGGMLGLFLLGFISRRVQNVDAVIGVICGFIVIAWISAAELLELPPSGIHEYLAIVFGTMTIFLVGFLLAKFIHRKK
ncbi:MAG: sodium:solute symporter [Prevotella sp.]|nr:sodium:solute symporter [Prevotella sp.]